MSSPTRIATHSDNKNVVAVQHVVSRSKRAELLGVDSKFHGCTIWFTGEALVLLHSIPQNVLARARIVCGLSVYTRPLSSVFLPVGIIVAPR